MMEPGLGMTNMKNTYDIEMPAPTQLLNESENIVTNSLNGKYF